jgi:hypothetical protein
MDFNKKLIDKIDNLVKLSSEFDTGFKVVFELDTDKINEQNAEILYSMTKNYILMRKEHGELILMINKQINSINIEPKEDVDKEQNKKNKKKKNIDIEVNNADIEVNNTMELYNISTFNTLLSNANDLINNIDYEYKKIALKYPKFINGGQITLILIQSTDTDNKYIKMIEELKNSHPEHKYKIINCGDSKSDISKCEKELELYGIKLKSQKSIPVIYIKNKSTITEIPLSKINEIEPIKHLLE